MGALDMAIAARSGNIVVDCAWPAAEANYFRHSALAQDAALSVS
jgi:ribosome biogenesis protein Tsr3